MPDFDLLTAHFVTVPSPRVVAGSDNNDNFVLSFYDDVANVDLSEWPQGSTIPASQARAVYAREQLRAYFGNADTATITTDGATATVLLTYPTASSLDPITGTWIATGNAVYFPVIKTGSGATASAPSFFVGFRVQQLLRANRVSRSPIVVILSNGVRLELPIGVDVDRVRNLVTILMS